MQGVEGWEGSTWESHILNGSGIDRPWAVTEGEQTHLQRARDVAQLAECSCGMHKALFDPDCLIN